MTSGTLAVVSHSADAICPHASAITSDPTDTHRLSQQLWMAAVGSGWAAEATARVRQRLPREDDAPTPSPGYLRPRVRDKTPFVLLWHLLLAYPSAILLPWAGSLRALVAAQTLHVVISIDATQTL